MTSKPNPGRYYILLQRYGRNNELGCYVCKCTRYLSDYARMRGGGQKERSRTSLSTYGVLFSSTSRGNVVEQPNDIISCMYLLPYVRGMAFLSNASPSWLSSPSRC